MSIALQRGGIGGRRRGVGCFPIYDPSPAVIAPAVQPASAADERLDSDTSSSSIGRNSDGEGVVEEGEVQSTYKGPLDTMDALEETLPIRRGISNFYCGKSKSFTSLTDAVSASSVKGIAKPEDPYTRKRKNLFALSSAMRDRARSHDDLLRRSIEGGTGFFAKRPANCSRSTFTIAVAASTSSSGSNSSSSEEEHEPVRRRLPPLHPRSKPAAAAVQSGTSPDEKLPLPVRSKSLSLDDLRGLPTTSASD